MSVDTNAGFDINSINESIFKLIGRDWMLVCAGTMAEYNMMTASWGSCGVLWNRPVATCFVRPQRYTFDFVERHRYFTLNFFPESFRDTLKLLGTRSGRDIDKMNIQGLSPLKSPNGSIYFNEARIVLECHKIYQDDIRPERFLEPSIADNYPQEDYHRFYIGEITNLTLNSPNA